MSSEEKEKLNEINFNNEINEIKESYYNNIFSRYKNYNNLKRDLKKFLSEANYNVYKPYNEAFSELDIKFDDMTDSITEQISDGVIKLIEERKKRIKYTNITLLGHAIILLWEFDFLVMSNIVPKVRSIVSFIENKLCKIQENSSKKLKLRKDRYKNLSRRKLINLINEYDKYIQQANNADVYKNGWYPVCINEFHDCQYQEIIKKKNVFNILKFIILNVIK